VVASHRAGVTAGGARASLLDWDLAALSALALGGGDPAAHPVAEKSAAAFSSIAARRSPDLTAWDGNLAGFPVPSPAGGEVLSASRLEAWAACGFRYFLGSVLRLGGRDDPERIIELGPTDRGSAVHEILEKFFTDQIAVGAPAPSTPWSDAQRARLAEIADEVFDGLEASGRTGRALHWQLQRRELALLLDEFLYDDDAYRARWDATPVRAEQPFGAKGVLPVVIDLGGERAVHFRGYADRIDATPSGHHLVTDYKTGKGDKYKFEPDPTQAGTALQLGLYSEAAVQLLGATSAQAHYWMVNPDAPEPPQVGYRWEPPQRERFVEVVGAIVDGIDRGVFAATPGEWDSWRSTHTTCIYCDFNEVCPVDRGEFAQLKASAPELAVRAALHGPGDDEAEAEASQ
jgi:ATP-dependent helicase/nuclease subunit B